MPACLAALVDFTRAAALQPNTRLIVAPYSHWDFVSLAGVKLIAHATIGCLTKHMSPPPPSLKSDATARASAKPNMTTAEPPPSPPAPSPPWGDSAESELPVQLCFLGSMRWRGFGSWPPPPSAIYRLWLCADRTLTDRTPTASTAGGPTARGVTEAREGGAAQASDRGAASLAYTYRPASPTPAAGGPSFNLLNAGSRSQATIEKRDDVLVFTSPPLDAPLSLAGAATLQLRLWASTRSVDLVGRLCRVDARGNSYNLCEGLTRVDAAASEGSIGGGGIGGRGEGGEGGGVRGGGGGEGGSGGGYEVPPPMSRMQSWKARAIASYGRARQALSTPVPPSATAAAPTAAAAIAVAAGEKALCNDESEVGAKFGGRVVSVVMSPLAVEFAAGERLRLHVCSAAHPRWMRNLLCDPEVPLHEQVVGSEACEVRVRVEAHECCLTLPVIECKSE